MAPLFSFLLAYNLVCRVMAMAAEDQDLFPWHVSFTGTLHALHQFLPLLATSLPIEEGAAAMIQCIVSQRVGDRPDRVEPRLVKKRPKQYKHLKKPRGDYKIQLA